MTSVASGGARSHRRTARRLQHHDGEAEAQQEPVGLQQCQAGDVGQAEQQPHFRDRITAHRDHNEAADPPQQVGGLLVGQLQEAQARGMR